MSTPTNYDDGGRRLRRRRKQAVDSEAPARVPAEEPSPESPVSDQIDRNAPGGVARHSDLLNKSDAEFPAAGDQRRDVAEHLQSRMGNQYVQRVVKQVSRARRRAPERSQAPAALEALPSRGPLIQRAGSGLKIQRDLAGSFPTSTGGFEMGMIAQTGALTGAGPSGLQGTIKFIPSKDAPYSNKIGIVQVVKLTDAGGANVSPVSLPATHGPGLRTAEDKKGGVEGGFFTDVLHSDPFISKKTNQPGDPLLPYYPFSNKGSQIFGFKRSEKADDIKAAEMFDFPGTTSKTGGLDFSFETVAKADDMPTVYGAVKWSFGLRAGAVVNEKMSVTDVPSATFDAALEKHRDFYVHEPVTFYFDFDSDEVSGTEEAKIDTFLDYLRRFPDVRLDLAGFADQRGSATYNRGLALRRGEAVAQALLRKGVDAHRINAPRAVGATTSFTTDAKTPQDEEANRRGNRRVTLTFQHTATPAVK